MAHFTELIDALPPTSDLLSKALDVVCKKDGSGTDEVVANPPRVRRDAEWRERREGRIQSGQAGVFARVHRRRATGWADPHEIAKSARLTALKLLRHSRARQCAEERHRGCARAPWLTNRPALSLVDVPEGKTVDAGGSRNRHALERALPVTMHRSA